VGWISQRKHHGFFGDPTAGRCQGLIVRTMPKGSGTCSPRFAFTWTREGFDRWSSDWNHQRLPQTLAEHLIEQGHLVVYATTRRSRRTAACSMDRWTRTTPRTRRMWPTGAQGKCLLRLPELRLRDCEACLLYRRRLKKQLHSCGCGFETTGGHVLSELDPFWKNAEAENWPSCVGFSIRLYSAADCEQFIAKVRTHNGAAAAAASAAYLGKRRSVHGCADGDALEADVVVEALKSVEGQLDALRKRSSSGERFENIVT